MRLCSYDGSDKKGASRTRSEGRQRRITLRVEEFLSDSESAHMEKAVIENAADPASRTTPIGGRRFLKDNVEEDDIIVVPEMLPNRFRKEQVSVSGSTAAEKANISRAGDDGKDEKDDQEKG